MEFQPGASGEIDHDPRQRLIQRHISMAVTPYAFLVAHRLGYRLSERDADIFHRVMRIDVQVAPGLDFQVDQAMPRNLVQHMVEEGYAGIQLLPAAAVEVEYNA